MSISPKLLFNDKSIGLILEAFDKEINVDGIIIEKSTQEPVLTPEGDEIHFSKFGGLKKGSEIFLMDDLFSIMNIVEGKY